MKPSRRLPGSKRAIARVVVVGAGFSGLSAAYELTLRGYRPMVLEADAEVGGLAATFEIDGTRIERFYHHWFTNDRLRDRARARARSRDRLVYKPTRTGMYFANRSTASRRHSTCLRFLFFRSPTGCGSASR